MAAADQTVVLRLVDQHGAEIPATVFQVGSDFVPTGSSISLPLGTNHMTIFPGLQGFTSNATLLFRRESPEVTASTMELVFEWITSTYTVRLRDQHGVDIPASQYDAVFGAPRVRDMGVPQTLPITDESIYPTMEGAYKDGYGTGIFPGLRGANSNATLLFRRASNLENNVAHDEYVYEWITATYTVDIPEAARFLGRTGAGALPLLDELLQSQVRATVKPGAVLGLGDLGTAPVAERVFALAEDGPPLLKAAAVQAIGNIFNPEAGPVLADAVADEGVEIRVRVAACRALGAVHDTSAVDTLAQVLADTGAPVTVRAAAAESLGKMGQPRALATVSVACRDASPEVARQARIARTRLEHVR